MDSAADKTARQYYRAVERLKAWGGVTKGIAQPLPNRAAFANASMAQDLAWFHGMRDILTEFGDRISDEIGV